MTPVDWVALVAEDAHSRRVSDGCCHCPGLVIARKFATGMEVKSPRSAG